MSEELFLRTRLGSYHGLPTKDRSLPHDSLVLLCVSHHNQESTASPRLLDASLLLGMFKKFQPFLNNPRVSIRPLLSK